MSNMNKQELVELISGYLTFLKSFFEEFRDSISLPKGEAVTPLLEEMISDVSNDLVPNLMFPRLKSLVNQIEIDRLKNLYRSWSHKHDFEKYEEPFQTVIIRGFFIAKTYTLFKAIGFINSNVVLIGANGCGKTTFADTIREELERTETGIVLPAQKLLIFPTYSFLPTFKSAYDVYNQRQKDSLNDKLTFNAGKSDDFPYEITKKYGIELTILLSALLGERLARRDRYCSEINTGDIVDTTRFRSKLDEVMEIWNDLITHRKLFCDDSGNLQIQYEDSQYPAYKMSDGEREILYVVGRILLAKDSSLIIVDEPELHLHKAILNKLWDRLEQRRKDCMFIYLTHDIDFASTRIAKKCWLRSYTPGIKDEWDVEPIEDNVIPESLLMKLLGSRKRLLFCEGDKSSLDCQLFEVLFPDYTITPVNSCKDVIDYTRAFNRLHNKYADAYGIIDSDFRAQEQLDKLATERIFSYNVAEIENLFLVEDFIKGFADYKKEPCDISDIKNRILVLFEKNIGEQTSLYVTQRINYQFTESHVKKGKTKEEVKSAFSAFVSQIDIEKWYNERFEELTRIVSQKDYGKAIRVYNNKGLFQEVEAVLGIYSYRKKAIDYLKSSEVAKDILRSVFPSELRCSSTSDELF